jgi:N-methylhydantoinase A/oxoprolinase/acetone carboxylase beta subunit
VPGGELRSSVAPESRKAWFGGDSYDATVLLDAPPAGESVDGPVLIEQAQATIVVPPGWMASSAGADVVLDDKAAA